MIGAAAECEIVDRDEKRPVGRRGEIKHAAFARGLNLPSCCVMHREHRAHARINFLRGAYDEHAFTLLRRKLEIIRRGGGDVAVEHAAHRYLDRSLGLVVRLRARELGTVASDECARVRDAEFSDHAHVVTSDRNLRRYFHGEVIWRLQCRSDPGMGKMKRIRLVQISTDDRDLGFRADFSTHRRDGI